MTLVLFIFYQITEKNILLTPVYNLNRYPLLSAFSLALNIFIIISLINIRIRKNIFSLIIHMNSYITKVFPGNK